MNYNNSSFFSIVLLLFTLSNPLSAQVRINIAIEWNKSNELLESGDDNSLFPATFSDAQYATDNPLPFYSGKIRITSAGNISHKIQYIKSEPVQLPNPSQEWEIPKNIQIQTSIQQERNQLYLVYSFIPLIKTSDGEMHRVTQVNFEFSIQPEFITKNRNPEFAEQSVLREGEIYKFAIDHSGLFKITAADLDHFGINRANLNPANIQIFGNPGGANPEAIAEERFDDLLENAIWIHGGEDGSFDNDDYIIIYAHGPHAWKVNDGGTFNYHHNIYDDNNYYFLKIGNANGLRITNRNNVEGEYPLASLSQKYLRYEIDAYNLLADFESTQGSGQQWFSEKYTTERYHNFSNFFKDDFIELSEPAYFDFRFAARSSALSKVNLKVDNINHEVNLNAVNVANIESTYADLKRLTFSQLLSSSTPSVELIFPNTANQSTGWLDYIEMQYKSKLVYNDLPLTFRNTDALDYDIFGFQIESESAEPWIWDITETEKIFNQKYLKLQDKISFQYEVNTHREFVIFEPTQVNNKVKFIAKIDNQNLHATTRADLVIIYHENFKAQAEKLAQHRATFNDYSVIAVPVDQIYNEFSSGKKDPTAIRNFARMLYKRDAKFNYLLLFGDGSFDYKHIRKNEYADENFIPVYETSNSLHPINSFPTDDYYALLDDQEGGNLVGQLDIAVGRLTVRTPEEAENIVNKLVNYDTNADTKGSWRLRTAFVGDDEDGNIHFRDADEIAERLAHKEKAMNIEKIYFDAFPQVSTPGGERFPEATAAINNNIFNGLLTICYLGHGGPRGWAQERVLKIDDIENWDNKNKLPLIVTATCSFTGFDDPKITSAGEISFLKKETGAIGLFTTVRAVYANQNKRLTSAVFDTIFSKDNGLTMPIGEILRRAKNSNSADTLSVNARKFLLVGDPSMRLALPDKKIVISNINGQPVDESYSADTIKALQKIQFEGFIENDEGKIQSDFNGTIFCSVFDKAIEAKTLGNNTTSLPRPFNIQKTILFKGQSSVINGKYSFEFYLPADINFEIGKGKISLYAASESSDAKGYFDNFYIGGSEPANFDDNPPIVDVYLNTEDFVFGGISSSNPILLVKLEDDFGINLSGVSIGHDLTAELDNDSKQRFILNEFYESELNDYRKGTVRFPLKDLEQGRHSIKVKAWDLSNNLGEGYTEFIVTDNIEESLTHVFNYPNPFSTSTYFQFQHNLAGTELEISINIFDLSGQLVKTINYDTIDDGFRVADIEWDGTNNSGAAIPNGIYLYKINLTATQLGIKKESNFEKLVILK